MDYYCFRPLWLLRDLQPRDGTLFFRALEKINRVRQSARSSSLSVAKKAERSRARMTAFILRKTAQNLPFADLPYDDIISLGTNNAIPCAKPRVSCVTAATQTDDSATTGWHTIETQTVESGPTYFQTVETQTEGPAPTENVMIMIRDATLFRDLEIDTLRQQLDHYITALDRMNKEYADVKQDNERLSTFLDKFEGNVTYLQSVVNAQLPQSNSYQHQSTANFNNRGRRRRGRYN